MHMDQRKLTILGEGREFEDGEGRRGRGGRILLPGPLLPSVHSRESLKFSRAQFKSRVLLLGQQNFGGVKDAWLFI